MVRSLQVEVVSADRLVWSGQAIEVRARTVDGDLGILSEHAPLLSLLMPGVVTVLQEGGDRWVGAVGSGFLSVANNRISVLAEYAQRGEEINLEAAEQALHDAESAVPHDGSSWSDDVDLARARVRAARSVA
jgi:F-type H+-transporting ATPase subunit epsilon